MASITSWTVEMTSLVSVAPWTSSLNNWAQWVNAAVCVERSLSGARAAWYVGEEGLRVRAHFVVLE